MSLFKTIIRSFSSQPTRMMKLPRYARHRQFPPNVMNSPYLFKTLSKEDFEEQSSDLMNVLHTKLDIKKIKISDELHSLTKPIYNV